MLDIPDKTAEYDSEPVVYCSRCFSLKIGYEEALGTEYCMECGCSDISESSIEEWERLYERRYGKKHVTKNDSIYNSPVFKMSIEDLKTALYKHPKWRDIINHLYPRFPKYYGRIDSILLLFDWLLKEKRVDELRLELASNH